MYSKLIEKKHISRTIRLTSIIILMVISGIIGVNQHNLNVNAKEITVDFEGPRSVSWDPIISIDGNPALAAFCSVGSGTWSDPYIIENYNISASAMHGIEISNTNAYLVIRDCFIGYGERNFGGINLEHCDNVNLTNNTIIHNEFGIILFASNNNTLSGNNCSFSTDGIIVDRSDNNIFLENSCDFNTCDFYMGGSNHNILTGNLMSKGLNLENPNNISIDTSNKVNGKSLHYFENVDNLYFGYNNDVGQVIMFNCTDSLIEHLEITNAYCGIYLISTNNIEITHITISNNFRGICMNSANNSKIWRNLFIGNEEHFEVFGIPYPVGTMWDNGEIGNYWSDYSDFVTDSLVNPDGITWSTPYSIDELNTDNFPMVDQLGIAMDTDNDGLYDNIEIYNYGLDPLNPDMDGDGLLDGEEIDLLTNPQNPDTDGDGFSDPQEVLYGFNPRNEFDPWWKIGAIGGGSITLIVGIIIYLKKRKNPKETSENQEFDASEDFIFDID